ncbi:hypothetical protein BJ508DRAFT_325427 [Ascobolus immersus RN42]|uniref:Uncharacterized protein n=1 Tax=Ascobolus immersus RN42 TaxID=1160509 RepID=A0A3N4ICN5_ASCIM|nr:hypothetical protein BJ508DRAFT_325427 [Ascobolus immersus RN42]
MLWVTWLLWLTTHWIPHFADHIQNCNIRYRRIIDQERNYGGGLVALDKYRFNKQLEERKFEANRVMPMNDDTVFYLISNPETGRHLAHSPRTRQEILDTPLARWYDIGDALGRPWWRNHTTNGVPTPFTIEECRRAYAAIHNVKPARTELGERDDRDKVGEESGRNRGVRGIESGRKRDRVGEEEG